MVRGFDQFLDMLRDETLSETPARGVFRNNMAVLVNTAWEHIEPSVECTALKEEVLSLGYRLAPLFDAFATPDAELVGKTAIKFVEALESLRAAMHKCPLSSHARALCVE